MSDPDSSEDGKAPRSPENHQDLPAKAPGKTTKGKVGGPPKSQVRGCARNDISDNVNKPTLGADRPNDEKTALSTQFNSSEGLISCLFQSWST